MKNISSLLIFLIILSCLPACANKKKQQYAGIDGDYISGIPLSERSGSANFLGVNVNRTEFAPISFAFDSTAVAENEKDKIDRVAESLRSSGQTVIIAGFTDDRGTEEYNRSLGERRALSVRQALIAKGIAARKIQTVSFGKEMPLDTASNETAWAKNRRAEFGIVQ